MIFNQAVVKLVSLRKAFGAHDGFKLAWERMTMTISRGGSIRGKLGKFLPNINKARLRLPALLPRFSFLIQASTSLEESLLTPSPGLHGTPVKYLDAILQGQSTT